MWHGWHNSAIRFFRDFPYKKLIFNWISNGRNASETIRSWLPSNPVTWPKHIDQTDDVKHQAFLVHQTRNELWMWDSNCGRHKWASEWCCSCSSSSSCFSFCYTQCLLLCNKVARSQKTDRQLGNSVIDPTTDIQDMCRLIVAAVVVVVFVLDVSSW